jgi:cysteine synthase
MQNSIPNGQNNKDYSITSEMIDMNYFNNIENIEDKKSYLGEIIFKQIEEHSLAQEYNMTMDTIGKITGMIINIDNINEIIETCQKKELLTSRIYEALDLLRQR